MPRFFSSVAPPLPFNPATRNVSSGSPASGTNFISRPRCVPTSTTSLSLPRDNHSRAIATAGITCPPVPPPAISNFTARLFSSIRGLLTDIQEHACSQEHCQKARTAVADERQRNSFCGHHPQYHSEINQRLAEHHRGNAQRQQPAETIRRRKCSAQPAPA